MVEQAGRDGDTPGFVGRQRELASLRQDIDRAGLHTLAGRPLPHSRILLIAGRPGSGRTALAVELVRRLVVLGGYPDGVLHVRLTEPDGTPVPTERTARRLLDALSVATVPGADGDELADELRSTLASRRTLLLLDDVATPDHLLDLLPETRDCLVVATAEGPLTGVSDVRPCTLGGLDQEAAVALLTQGAGAVRVTVDPRAAEELAEECAGQPAALVLMAGWLAAHPEAAVADALLRLRAADGVEPAGEEATPKSRPPGRDGVTALPTPLTRAFHLVRRSLPGPAARMLPLLVLAPAGCVDAQTASALAGCTVASATTVLDDFLALGLLRPVPPPAPPHPGSAAPGIPQYTVPRCLYPLLHAQLTRQERPPSVLLARARMLERTVRQLRSCWASGEPDGSAVRDWAAALPRSLRFGSTAAAGGWLHARLPVLLAAARLAAYEGDGELDTLARRLVAHLSRALALHRTPSAAAPELYRLHELVLAVTERCGAHRESAAALLALGDLDSDCDRYPQALTRYRAALDAARQAADGVMTGQALERLGVTYQRQGDGQRAADWYGRALILRQTGGDLAAEARLYGLIGAAHAVTGHWAPALREWRAAAAAYRRLRDQAGYARALSEVAGAQQRLGLVHEALRTTQEALEAVGQSASEPEPELEPELELELQLRAAGICEELGDLVAARAHRLAAERGGAEPGSGTRGARGRGGEERGGGGRTGEERGGAEPGGAGERDPG